MASPPGAQLRSPVLRSLISSLGRPSFRKAFAADPYRALERAGISADGLPPGQLDVLAGLDPDDLAIVSSVLLRLRELHPGRVLSL